MREMKEKLQLCKGTDKYDQALKEIRWSGESRAFFGDLHPELLPYVGQSYEKTRVLLMGESHYVGDATELPVNWYHEPLPEDGAYPFNRGDGAKDWFDTREVIVRYVNHKKPQEYKGKYDIGKAGRGHSVFSRPTKVLLSELQIETTTENLRSNFNYFAFMNFFQSPALTKGESIDDTKEDRSVATEILVQVVNVLQPRAVVFLSKKAYNAFTPESYPTTKIEVVSHPTCAWWYRPRKDGRCAADDFREILRDVLAEGEIKSS